VNHGMRIWILGLLVASLAVPVLAQTGADTYKAKCAMCHGPDGLAATSMAKMLKVPSFKSPDLIKAPESQLIEATTNGKNNKMPAYKDKLTAAQIKEVVAYIRTLQK
jgi:cytochrome c6